eukprot:gene19712-23582_t
MRGPHDVGGDQVDHGKLELAERDLEHWETQTDVIFCALSAKKFMGVDQLRRTIEALPAQSYAELSYYGKWAAACITGLKENGLISEDDIHDALGPEDSTDTVLFRTSDCVRVKEESHGGLRWRKPHLRVPGYIFGCTGVIERVCGVFPNPEASAFGSTAMQPLYRVRFNMRNVWRMYEGGEMDSCDVEVYQSWLEPACGPEGAADNTRANKRARTQDPHHGHSHGHEDHTHLERSAVEQAAVDKEGEEGASQRIASALYRIVTAKSLMTTEEITTTVESIQNAGLSLSGPKIVARAWTDNSFRELLLKDASAACTQLGVTAANNTATTVLTVVANTPTVHNLVVCTLCSCYPRSILGMSPDWYKSRSYRSRAVLQPRAVLKEFGTDLPVSTEIRVHDSTADLRYLVLPMRPEGTTDWTEEDLQTLVSRNSMI